MAASFPSILAALRQEEEQWENARAAAQAQHADLERRRAVNVSLLFSELQRAHAELESARTTLRTTQDELNEERALLKDLKERLASEQEVGSKARHASASIIRHGDHPAALHLLLSRHGLLHTQLLLEAHGLNTMRSLVRATLVSSDSTIPGLAACKIPPEDHRAIAHIARALTAADLESPFEGCHVCSCVGNLMSVGWTPMPCCHSVVCEACLTSPPASRPQFPLPFRESATAPPCPVCNSVQWGPVRSPASQPPSQLYFQSPPPHFQAPPPHSDTNGVCLASTPLPDDLHTEEENIENISSLLEALLPASSFADPSCETATRDEQSCETATRDVSLIESPLAKPLERGASKYRKPLATETHTPPKEAPQSKEEAAGSVTAPPSHSAAPATNPEAEHVATTGSFLRSSIFTQEEASAAPPRPRAWFPRGPPPEAGLAQASHAAAGGSLPQLPPSLAIPPATDGTGHSRDASRTPFPLAPRGAAAPGVAAGAASAAPPVRAAVGAAAARPSVHSEGETRSDSVESLETRKLQADAPGREAAHLTPTSALRQPGLRRPPLRRPPGAMDQRREAQPTGLPESRLQVEDASVGRACGNVPSGVEDAEDVAEANAMTAVGGLVASPALPVEKGMTSFPEAAVGSGATGAAGGGEAAGQAPQPCRKAPVLAAVASIQRAFRFHRFRERWALRCFQAPPCVVALRLCEHRRRCEGSSEAPSAPVPLPGTAPPSGLVHSGLKEEMARLTQDSSVLVAVGHWARLTAKRAWEKRQAEKVALRQAEKKKAEKERDEAQELYTSVGATWNPLETALSKNEKDERRRVYGHRFTTHDAEVSAIALELRALEKESCPPFLELWKDWAPRSCDRFERFAQAANEVLQAACAAPPGTELPESAVEGATGSPWPGGLVIQALAGIQRDTDGSAPRKSLRELVACCLQVIESVPAMFRRKRQLEVLRLKGCMAETQDVLEKLETASKAKEKEHAQCMEALEGGSSKEKARKEKEEKGAEQSEKKEKTKEKPMSEREKTKEKEREKGRVKLRDARARQRVVEEQDIREVRRELKRWERNLSDLQAEGRAQARAQWGRAREELAQLVRTLCSAEVAGAAAAAAVDVVLDTPLLWGVVVGAGVSGHVLACASRARDLQRVRRVLQAGSATDATDAHGNTALHAAFHPGDAPCPPAFLRGLLDPAQLGFPPPPLSARNALGATALRCALVAVSARANAHPAPIGRTTALLTWLAPQWGSAKKAEDHAHAQDEVDGVAALLEHETLELHVELLVSLAHSEIEEARHLFARDPQGVRVRGLPLHPVAAAGPTQICFLRQLLLAGADPNLLAAPVGAREGLRHGGEGSANAVTHWQIGAVAGGVAALHVVPAEGGGSVVRALLMGGADANLRSTEGMAPLHVHVSNDEVAYELLRGGADPTATNASGESAFDLCESVETQKNMVRRAKGTALCDPRRRDNVEELMDIVGDLASGKTLGSGRDVADAVTEGDAQAALEAALETRAMRAAASSEDESEFSVKQIQLLGNVDVETMFSGALWELCMTKPAKDALLLLPLATRLACLQLLAQLGTGAWDEELDTPMLRKSKEVKLLRSSVDARGCMLWEVSVDFSARRVGYVDVIVVWAPYCEDCQVAKTAQAVLAAKRRGAGSSIQHHLQLHQRDSKMRVDARTGRRVRLPRGYLKVAEATAPAAGAAPPPPPAGCIAFSPPAVDTADGVTVQKFITLTAAVASAALQARAVSTLAALPFRCDEQEVRHATAGDLVSTILVGRSGTGKTTVVGSP
ncbi:hypothetical protein CYMTET_38433 [Cymbomonas tetramitiformis]|uniref:Uncharacterized protein n=1 Tax=Cymbomonas tetramitiformis TaxID=36881 RepID=A0AAE0F5H3_9CHLO|nr:hypothetical protein CYMTET_38433 [Cymbomonas tetramitiformis]